MRKNHGLILLGFLMLANFLLDMAPGSYHMNLCILVPYHSNGRESQKFTKLITTEFFNNVSRILKEKQLTSATMKNRSTNYI